VNTLEADAHRLADAFGLGPTYTVVDALLVTTIEGFPVRGRDEQ
jgi:hypothetical protein